MEVETDVVVWVEVVVEIEVTVEVVVLMEVDVMVEVEVTVEVEVRVVVTVVVGAGRLVTEEDVVVVTGVPQRSVPGDKMFRLPPTAISSMPSAEFWILPSTPHLEP